MKPFTRRILFGLVTIVLVMAWIVHFHNAAVRSPLPNWGWLQKSVAFLGEKTEAAPADEDDPDNTQNEIPVHTAHITVATVHRYIEGFGTIVPRPARDGQLAGSASIASPTAGTVAKILCEVGQKIHAGDALIQLDDRLAKAAQDQAAAGLAEAHASLAVLKATPRPDQLEAADAAVKKAQGTVDLTQKTFDRLTELAADQGTSTKSVESAANDLASAKDDLDVSQKQLAVLKASPTPEELAQEQAKVAQATAALASAHVQREMLTITSPIDGTVASLSVNPGESVDPTRTLVQVIAMDRLMVDLDIPAPQLPPSPEGLPAQIITPYAATTENAAPPLGKISSVSPQVDAKNGTVMVTIDLPADTTLRAGLSVRVRIVAEEHKNVFVVPRAAVVADENGDSVIAVVDGDQATHKSVKPGIEENGMIEITADGLKEGMTVVTAGAYGLPQATRVKVLD